eukprot:766727-Hanusia_phi.AAC.9
MLDDVECRMEEDHELDMDGALDSDEEMALYDELDQLLEAQERTFKQGVRWEKLSASIFRRIALRIVENEVSFGIFVRLFDRSSKDPLVGRSDLTRALESLGAPHGLDLDDIYMEVEKSEGESSQSQPHSEEVSYHLHHKVYPLSTLVANSAKLRKMIIELEVDDVLCLLMNSSLSQVFSEETAKSILSKSFIRSFNEDQLILKGKTDKNKHLIVVLSGEILPSWEKEEEIGEQGMEPLDTPADLQVGWNKKSEDKEFEQLQLGHGNYFGSYQSITGKKSHLTVRSKKITSLLYMPIKEVLHLLVAKTNEEQTNFLGYSVESMLNPEPCVDLHIEIHYENVPSISRTQSSSELQHEGKIQLQNRMKSMGNVMFSGAAEHDESVRRMPITVPEVDRQKLRDLFKGIDELWKAMSLGSKSVQSSQARTIENHTGESGAACFREIFHILWEEGEAKEVLDCQRYWISWLEFLRGDALRGEEMHAGVTSEDKVNSSSFQVARQEGLFAKLQRALEARRKLRDEFLNADLKMWEGEFVKVTGGLEKPLVSSGVRRFVKAVMIDYPHRITNYNCEEFGEFSADCA